MKTSMRKQLDKFCTCDNSKPMECEGCRINREQRAAIEAIAQPVQPASTDKHWCETCDGCGTIDETLGGEHFSNPKAECPDCDGNGYWIRRSQPVQPTSKDFELALRKHEGNCCVFERGVQTLDDLLRSREVLIKAVQTVPIAPLDEQEIADMGVEHGLVKENYRCEDLVELVRRIEARYTSPIAQPVPPTMPCIGRDPLCPCQDGDACHYQGDTPFAIPVPTTEGDAKDAERLDWLSESFSLQFIRQGCNHKVTSGARLRDHIDAAIASQKATPQGKI